MKNSRLYASYDSDANKITIHSDYFEGTASQATHASNADDATKATGDKLGQDITTYLREVSSSYTGGEPCTVLTFTLGNDTEVTVKAKDTQYDIFTESTAGLVDSPTPAHTVDSDETNKILTGSGWMNKTDTKLVALNE